MNKKELQKDIEQMEAKLAEMKNKLKEKEQWHPKGGMYFINSVGSVLCSQFDKWFCNFGVEFASQKQAEKGAKAFRKYHRLYQLALELNRDWEPDWSNEYQFKYCIYYSYYSNTWEISHVSFIDYPTFVYFKSKEVAEEAIRLITECNALGE